MSNRIFGTEKVDDIIGLKDRKAYDNIDVFVDITNNNNVWGMVYSTEYKNHEPIKKQEIVHFLNYQEMIDFIKENFNGYELDHPVAIEHKQLFFHFIDYCDIEYFYHEGKPNLNYIEIKYYEYENGTHICRRMRFPKEYEDLFKMILKVSKKIPDNVFLGPQYHRDVDVYEERDQDRKNVIRSITVPIGEFFQFAGDKIRNIKNLKKSPKLYKNLKIMISTITLSTLLAGGYHIVTENNYNSEFLRQDNPIRNVQDIGVYANKGRAGVIIGKLLAGKYDEITPEDLKFVTEFIKTANNNNFDGNDSFNSFNYSEYFMYEVGGDERYGISADVLKKIEFLYNNCFYTENGKTVIVPENVKKYIDYVGSLTFLYDTYHSDKSFSNLTIDTQSPISPYATREEIETFDSYPPILRYIILVQLKGLMSRCDYQLDSRPSYYFGGMDKYDFLTEISNKIGLTLDEMFFQCGYNGGKSL